MYTIVVADDEEELRRAIIRRINWEEIGFQVVGEAENGVEALEMVSEKEPDLLLTDIRMPFISGVELARQVREIRPATQIAFLSGFDDFSYAQQAIQYNIISYMLKPISMADLTENLIQIKQKIDHLFSEFAQRRKNELGISEFLLPLLLDSFQTNFSPEREERLCSQAKACGMIRPESENIRYLVISVTFWDEKGANCTDHSHVHSVDSILKKYIKYESFFLEDRIVSVLWATPASFDKYLHILADDIVQSTDRILNLKCSVGASRVLNGFTELSEGYRDAVNAMRYASRSKTGGVRYITDEEPFSGVDMDYVMKVVASIEEKIRGGSREELEEYLWEVFGHLRDENNSREKVNFMLVEILSCVCRIMYSVSAESDAAALKSDPFMQQMVFLDSSLKDAADHFVNFCMTARDRISEQKTKSSMDICDKAIRHIEDNYFKADLSLMSASTEIGVSPNYLSSLIKKRTGKSFVDYLTQKRMEAAKTLLLNTAMKIKEVSETCGYNDQHYFSYCFKKYEGVSPNMLRRRLSQEEKQG